MLGKTDRLGIDFYLLCDILIICSIVLFKYWTKKISLLCHGCIFIKGGPIVVREVTSHWMDSLVASPNQKDVVRMHVKETNLHFYAPTGHEGKKYMCAPEAQCKSNQQYFQKDRTTSLYKHFLQQNPL